MKPDWITRAIGRHLVNLPASAKLSESYIFYEDKIEPLPIKNRHHFEHIVDIREAELKKTLHRKRKESMFIERVLHPNGSVTLVSWADPASEVLYLFDTYFLIGSKAVKYSGDVSPTRKQQTISEYAKLSQEWRELKPGEIPEGIGFVAGEVILVDKDFNLEDWSLSVRFADKPEVNFIMYGIARRNVKPGLRQRAGGATGFLAAVLAGRSTLRSRARPVGPIEADEILMAATQNGRRSYGFKWEAPGKASSLAEPYLIADLTDGIQDPEAAGPTSFKDDDEALALWDEIIDSIRLRPGAAG
jgi:hypothetical protein